MTASPLPPDCRPIKILDDDGREKLDWIRCNIEYPKIYRIGAIGDGTCLFHAIVKAFHLPYIDQKVDRRKFIAGLKKELSDALNEKMTKFDEKGGDITYYDFLSRGNLREFSKTDARYSLANMKQELLESKGNDNLFIEYLSEVLNKDIYILDQKKQDIYIQGDDRAILYKKRPSIVVLYLEDLRHYELIGVEREGKIETMFSPEDPFILNLQNRMNQIFMAPKK
jgi:hypothetical protein